MTAAYAGAVIGLQVNWKAYGGASGLQTLLAGGTTTARVGLHNASGGETQNFELPLFGLRPTAI